MSSAAVVQEVLQGDDGLEDERSSGQPSEANSDQLRASELTLLNYTRTCQWKQRQPLYGRLALEANWKGKRTRLNGCLMSWLEIFKNRPFKVLSSLILLNSEPFPDQIVTWQKRILYDRQQPAKVGGLRRSS